MLFPGRLMPVVQTSKDHPASILRQKTCAIFDGVRKSKPLGELCLDLLLEQKKGWPDLMKGYESFEGRAERDIPCNGFSVRVQHNPGRIKSSTANVGKKGVEDRGCFLCLDRLPEDQNGILYRDEFLILCNPAPILTAHLTVSHVDHCRQVITEHIETFLRLMADFGSGWVVLYNGPRCGASAPHHLHFQAAPSGQMPIEKDIREQKRLVLKEQREGVLFYRVEGLGREVVILEGEDQAAVGTGFIGFLKDLQKSLLPSEEPMMNIVGLYEAGRWQLAIFPRRKHRPDAFFKKGKDRLVVSPGVIDMAGILVTPVERDFERLDAAAVKGIYKEVSLEGEAVERVLRELDKAQRA
jgi:hypothetical protein